MRDPSSWTSSIVGFALAVLLVAWALDQFAEVVRDNWPILVGALVVVAAAIVGVTMWHRRDYW